MRAGEPSLKRRFDIVQVKAKSGKPALVVGDMSGDEIEVPESEVEAPLVFAELFPGEVTLGIVPLDRDEMSELAGGISDGGDGPIENKLAAILKIIDGLAREGLPFGKLATELSDDGTVCVGTLQNARRLSNGICSE